MEKENTAIRLKKIMDERGIRQVDILNLAAPYCEKYNVKMNKSDLSQYCSGKTEPNQDKLFVLGAALNVNEAWLMGYDVPMERNHYEDQTILRFDAEFDDARDIIESAGYLTLLSDNSNDIIIKNTNNEIIACMHDYELVNKYESLQRRGASITADALLENEEVTRFFNKMNAFEMQLKSLGWTYEPMGCHAVRQSIEFEIKLDDSGNFINTEDNDIIGCNEKKCENCTDKESYYLFSNGKISFKVSPNDYDSFIDDSQIFFKERLQQLLKKSMKQLFVENSIDSKSYLDPVAARERTDIEVTDEMRKHDDDIMDDPDF